MSPTEYEIQRITGIVDDMKAKAAPGPATKSKVRPAYVSKLDLALAEQRRGVPMERMRPDWRAALQQHLAEEVVHNDPE